MDSKKFEIFMRASLAQYKQKYGHIYEKSELEILNKIQEYSIGEMKKFAAEQQKIIERDILRKRLHEKISELKINNKQNVLTSQFAHSFHLFTYLFVHFLYECLIKLIISHNMVIIV